MTKKRSEESKAKNREFMRVYNISYYAKNKEKVLARNKKYALKHPEMMTRISREWRKKNPEKTKSARLKYMYGITLAEYNSLCESQKGLCAICCRPNKRILVVDHSHKTRKVRGLLCDSCNLSLGLLGEDTEVIKAVLTYLQKYE